MLVQISWERTLPYLSTGISNLLQPAQAEAVLGQRSRFLASWDQPLPPGKREAGRRGKAGTAELQQAWQEVRHQPQERGRHGGRCGVRQAGRNDHLVRCWQSLLPPPALGWGGGDTGCWGAGKE